jgi:hypothetical protein
MIIFRMPMAMVFLMVKIPITLVQKYAEEKEPVVLLI